MPIYKKPGEPYSVGVRLTNRGSLTSPQFLVSKRILLAGRDAQLPETRGYFTLSPGQSTQLTFSGALFSGITEEGWDFTLPEDTPLDLRVRVYKSPYYYYPQPWTEDDYAKFPDALLAEAIVPDAYRIKAKFRVNLWLCNPPLVSIWYPFVFIVPVTPTAPNYSDERGYVPIGEGATVGTYEDISTIYLAYRLFADARWDARIGDLYVCEPVNVVSGQTLYIDHNTGAVSTYSTGPTDIPRATVNVSATWMASNYGVSRWLLWWSEATGTMFQRSDGRNALDAQIPCISPYMVFLRAYWWTGYTSWDGPFTIEPGVSYDWTPGGPEKTGTLVPR